MNTSFHPPYKQVLLIVLDGWGYSTEEKDNAIFQANPQYFNHLWSKFPHALLPASGEAVGLPDSIIGTSEIGHSIIGTGKILYTDLLRINKAITENTLGTNSAIQELFQHVKKNSSTLHLIGLLSPGGVHSHQDHLFALIRLAKANDIHDVAIHVITDGRDTPPQSAAHYIEDLEKVIEETGIGYIASISGRYYAMDRDKNWERTQKELDVIFEGKGNIFNSGNLRSFIDESYKNNINDEFIVPTVLANQQGKKTSIRNNDGVMFFNYRPDRARQLSEKIVARKDDLNLCFVTMTQYDPTINSLVAFTPEKVETSLSQEISNAGLTQVHIAETEKYAHVTYFLNGGDETKHLNEEFIMIESRKDIPTHDLAPEMKAKDIADKTIEYIKKGTNFIVINFANADMVGHTGKWEPTLEAIKVLDHQIQRVVEAMEQEDGVVFITADHGNAEKMYDNKNDQPYTAHTLNKVPAILTATGITMHDGTLADVAPTILSLFQLPIPQSMSGTPLIDQS